MISCCPRRLIFVGIRAMFATISNLPVAALRASSFDPDHKIATDMYTKLTEGSPYAPTPEYKNDVSACNAHLVS